jgi:undecaprenyl-diphosphatase
MQLDDWIDKRATKLPGKRVLDPLMYGASWFGDDGKGWMLASVVQARKAPEPLRAVARHLVWLGIESAIVNGPAKGAVRRPRPTRIGGQHPHRLRKPSNSSFPSGHAASAATMASLLSEEGFAPLWWSIAAIVAASRVYVGVHHFSDVAAGFAVGAGIGVVARHVDLPWLPRPASLRGDQGEAVEPA